MKGKYVTNQILMACLSKPPGATNEIYEQLEETITERKKIIQQVDRAFFSKTTDTDKDIHTQLEETIAERKKIMQQLQRLYEQRKSPVFIWTGIKAA